jgi:HTH-type transcriptional regulator, sugar sensing transcriptional regulator
MDTAILEEIGLTKAEIKVYLALLELGSSTTGPIVEKSGASSSKIYEILDKLMDKGLATVVIEANTKYFEAVSPERLLDYLEEKQKNIAQKKEELEGLIPELKLKQQLSKHRKDASIYRGMKGLESAFEEGMKEMKKGDHLCVIGVPARSEGVNRFFIKHNKEAAKKGIALDILFDETARNDPQAQKANHPRGEIKFLPKGILTPAAINIFKESTIIFPAEEGDEPLLIMVKSKDVADSFRAQFNILWNQQAVVITGLDGPRKVINGILETEGDNVAMGLQQDQYLQHIPETMDKFFKTYKQKNLKGRIILKEGERLRYTIKGKEKEEKSHGEEMRFLPKEYFSPLTLEVYGNTVALVDWTEPITTIFIEKKEIAEGFMKYFNVLWKMAKP